MKSPIKLDDLPFATAMADFEPGGALEIDGDYDRVRFDGVAFDAAAATGARFTESAFIGGSFDEGRLRKARFTDVWFEQTRLVAVDKNGPAAAAGLQPGDVITQLDDVRLDSAHPLALLLRTRFHPNQRVTVTYSRGGASTQAELTLASQHPTCS